MNVVIFATGGGTHTLPSAVGITGRTYTLRARSTCTIQAAGSSNIDGSSSYTLSAGLGVKFISDGANWNTY